MFRLPRRIPEQKVPESGKSRRRCGRRGV